jgi:hypothetical protein
MGEKETLAFTVVDQLPTPPLGDLQPTFRHLIENQRTSQGPSREQASPPMAHEAYLASQYGTSHYQDPHGVGLGIQHVCFASDDWHESGDADLYSTNLSIQLSHFTKDTDRTLDLL